MYTRLLHSSAQLYLTTPEKRSPGIYQKLDDGKTPRAVKFVKSFNRKSFNFFKSKWGKALKRRVILGRSSCKDTPRRFDGEVKGVEKALQRRLENSLGEIKDAVEEAQKTFNQIYSSSSLPPRIQEQETSMDKMKNEPLKCMYNDSPWARENTEQRMEQVLKAQAADDLKERISEISTNVQIMYDPIDSERKQTQEKPKNYLLAENFWLFLFCFFIGLLFSVVGYEIFIFLVGHLASILLILFVCYLKNLDISILVCQNEKRVTKKLEFMVKS